MSLAEEKQSFHECLGEIFSHLLRVYKSTENLYITLSADCNEYRMLLADVNKIERNRMGNAQLIGKKETDTKNDKTKNEHEVQRHLFQLAKSVTSECIGMKTKGKSFVKEIMMNASESSMMTVKAGAIPKRSKTASKNEEVLNKNLAKEEILNLMELGKDLRNTLKLNSSLIRTYEKHHSSSCSTKDEFLNRTNALHTTVGINNLNLQDFSVSDFLPNISELRKFHKRSLLASDNPIISHRLWYEGANKWLPLARIYRYNDIQEVLQCIDLIDDVQWMKLQWAVRYLIRDQIENVKTLDEKSMIPVLRCLHNLLSEGGGTFPIFVEDS